MKGVEFECEMLSSLVLCVEALEMEARMASVELLGVGAGEVEPAPDMVRPRASVVVGKSHCFASAVFGLRGAPLAFPPV